MKEIPLTQGKVARVDDVDFDRLSKWKWQYSNRGYAIRTDGKRPNRKTILMHRIIMDTPDGLQTDHRDSDKLNNQRTNLRICTAHENQRNRTKYSNNNTGFKGVSKKRKRFCARIALGGININLGTFRTPEEAARVYLDASILHHGEFARA